MASYQGSLEATDPRHRHSSDRPGSFRFHAEDFILLLLIFRIRAELPSCPTNMRDMPQELQNKQALDTREALVFIFANNCQIWGQMRRLRMGDSPLPDKL